MRWIWGRWMSHSGSALEDVGLLALPRRALEDPAGRRERRGELGEHARILRHVLEHVVADDQVEVADTARGLRGIDLPVPIHLDQRVDHRHAQPALARAEGDEGGVLDPDVDVVGVRTLGGERERVASAAAAEVERPPTGARRLDGALPRVPHAEQVGAAAAVEPAVLLRAGGAEPVQLVGVPATGGAMQVFHDLLAPQPGELHQVLDVVLARLAERALLERALEDAHGVALQPVEQRLLRARLRHPFAALGDRFHGRIIALPRRRVTPPRARAGGADPASAGGGARSPRAGGGACARASAARPDAGDRGARRRGGARARAPAPRARGCGRADRGRAARRPRANSSAAARCAPPSASPRNSIANSAPKNGALANTLCARVAPSACDAEIKSAMLAP